MRKMIVLIACLAFAVAAQGNVPYIPVTVVHGYESVPAGERGFALSLANHIMRWYKEAGVEGCALTDDSKLDDALRWSRVTVLVYLAQPTAKQLQRLREYVGKGNTLIVFYSSSPELAALMGVEIVGYQKGSTDGRWSQMRFVKGAPRGVPETILQTSSNLFVVKPVEGRSQVLAWWHDRQGKQTTEAAWLSSPQGYWMTHVLSGDGDAKAKGELMLALAAAHDPVLWDVAAKKRLDTSRKVIRNVSGPAALKAMAEKAQNRRAVSAAEGAEKAEANAARLSGERKHYEAWVAANELRERMFETYGMMQSPRKGEIRAVWDHSGRGLYPGDWARTCRLLKDAGFTDLYVNVAGAGFAHYASAVLPRSRVLEEMGDQLAQCVAAAKPLGLRVHAWLLCFSTEGATQDRLAILAQRKWTLTDANGRLWLDPAVPEARTYLVNAVKEMATKYKVDGVHLDFVRYPTGDIGAKKSPVHVTDFVQSARRVMTRDAPGKVLTAAVFGKYPSCVDAVGQDWEAWLDTGLLDYAVPMNYTEDMAKFNEWLSAQTRTRKQAIKIIAGIGVTAADSRLDSAQVIDQINAVRKSGAPGFALFNLDTTMRTEILPVLRLGATAPAQ